ncbi:Proline--tRNA ligase [subsurface metagenome]
MRYSRLLGKSLREVPHESPSESYSLLLKAGFVRQLGQGLFSFLPLGMRVIKKIELLISEEMEKLGGQEILAPVVTPAEIWRKSGRYAWNSKELISFHDRHGRELVLSPTHEEAFVELIRSSLSSYRDLPILLYQQQIKFRDEEKPRSGLVRSKEFLMCDAYSFHRSSIDLNNFFPRMFAAYKRIFERSGIETTAVEAGVGFMGGEKSYEFLMPAQGGDQVIINCERCSYCANRDIAAGAKERLTGRPLPLEKVSTSCCTTMDELSDYLHLPRQKLAKSVVYSTPEGLVMAVVRGDYEVGEEKLSAYLKYPAHRLATNEELLAAGLVPGYLSPFGTDGMENPIRIVVDDTVANSPNLVFEADEEGYHLLNVNFGRDFESSDVTDISLTKKENVCLQCGGKLGETPAIEMGHIFKLGDYYSRAMNLVFQEDRGATNYPHMGCYGIGLGRLMDAVVKGNHDEKGIIWPSRLAPYKVFLMSIGKSLGVKRVVEKLYEELKEDALYDDRDESPGVKFMDADLIGLPVRIVVSSKHLGERMVEIRERRTGKITLVPAQKAAQEVEAIISAAQA